jgi:hypothetical protein
MQKWHLIQTMNRAGQKQLRKTGRCKKYFIEQERTKNFNSIAAHKKEAQLYRASVGV